MPRTARDGKRWRCISLNTIVDLCWQLKESLENDSDEEDEDEDDEEEEEEADESEGFEEIHKGPPDSDEE